jgi:transcriptional regulator GlxA family with amidase domain
MRFPSKMLGQFPVAILPRVVAILGFDGVATLDITGPIEALAAADSVQSGEDARVRYKPMIVGLNGKVFYSDAGLAFRTQRTIKSMPACDTIIIPGGNGLRQPEISRRIADWLKLRAPRTRRIASISTGILPLAESGLLNGRAVTTHWRVAREVAQRFPRLRLSYSAPFFKDDRFYTASNGIAGVEMTLAMIQEDHGARLALAVRRELIARLHPLSDGEQDSESQAYQSDPVERIAELPAWILTHLDCRLTVTVLAARACLCRRHFTRVFRQVFNCSPSDFVEELRMNEARRRLVTMPTKVERLAQELGFHSSDAFRRAFERRVGVSPTAFRRELRST